MVALHVGAWIETSPLRVQSIHFVSRSTWARGLKLAIHDVINDPTVVALHVGAWIETALLQHGEAESLSRSTWARGLKHDSPSSTA